MKKLPLSVFPLLSALLVALLWAAPALAQQCDDALRSAVQNPLADLISLPFQNNTSFGIGPHDRTQNTLNIQPVYPVAWGTGSSSAGLPGTVVLDEQGRRSACGTRRSA